MLAYLKLLVRNRLASLMPGGRRREGQKAWKAALSWAGIALMLLVLYAMVVFLEMAVYNQGKVLGEPQAVIALVFLGCTMMTLIYSFFYVISLLFFGKDSAFVGALPIASRGVLAAKLATVLLGEIGLTLLVCAPLLIRYGVELGAGVGYYARSLAGMLFVPVIPVAVTTLMSFALIRVSALWKRREGVTTVMTFVLLIAVVGVQMSLNMSMDKQQMTSALMGMMLGQGSITSVVLAAYPPLQWLTNAAVGNGLYAWGQTALFIGVSAAALALVILLFGGSYMRLALKQAENIQRAGNAKRRRAGDLRVLKPFWALYRQEMREVVTVPTYATNCLTGVVLFPVIIVVMFIGMQNNMGAESLMELVAELLPRSMYLAVAAAFLCMTATMGLAVSTAVSREGARHDIRRVYPVSGAVQLGAKLLMGVTYNAVAALFSAAALWALLPRLWLETLIALAVSQLFSLLWCMISLLLDVYHPRLKWKTEAEAVKQSMNAMVSMLIGFLAVGLLVGAVVLLIQWGVSLAAALAAGVLLIVIMDALLWALMSRKASVTYCLREYTN